jgi:hypothetical protein
LFSITKMTGRARIAAKLSDSWKAPMLAVPSPKIAAATRSVPRARRHGRAAGHRQAGPDDGEGGQQANVGLDEMHRAPEAAGAADGAAADLADHRQRRHAERQRMRMAAVGAGHDVVGVEHAGDAHRHRLLAVGKMGGSADVPVGEQRLDPRLDGTDLGHPAQLLDPVGQRRPPGAGFGGTAVHAALHHGAGPVPVAR